MHGMFFKEGLLLECMFHSNPMFIIYTPCLTHISLDENALSPMACEFHQVYLNDSKGMRFSSKCALNCVWIYWM